LTNSWLSIDHEWSANNNCDGRQCNLPHRLPRISEFLFITTSMDDHDEEKRTEQKLFIHSDNSEDEVTNNRRLRSMYCTVESDYWQTRSIARPLCGSRTSFKFQSSTRTAQFTVHKT